MATRAARATALGAGVLLAGCGGWPSDVCPAIAYLPTVVVEVADDATAEQVATVRVCPVADDASTDAADDGCRAVAERREDGRWHVVDLTQEHDELVVDALDVDGTTLVSRTVEPAWERVGGSERCGGPHEANIVL